MQIFLTNFLYTSAYLDMEYSCEPEKISLLSWSLSYRGRLYEAYLKQDYVTPRI